MPNNSNPISKQTFLSVIYALRQQQKKEEAFAEAMQNMLDGKFVATLADDVVVMLVKVLEEIYDDTISYFIYELDFGRRDKDSMKINGKKIPLGTVENLWNYCKGLKK